MNDTPLPDDLAEIAREAEALVAAALDADAKQAAAKGAVQNAVEQIVNKAQDAVVRLYGYLKPGAPAPVLAVLWPVADAPQSPTVPVITPDPAPPVAEAPVAEAPVVEAPVVEPAAPEAPPADQVIVPPADDFPVGEPDVAEQPAADPNAAANTEPTNG